MLLNNKFGVAIGICNQLSLGWGTREQRKNIIMNNMSKWCIKKKKRMKEGTKALKIRVTSNSIVPIVTNNL